MGNESIELMIRDVSHELLDRARSAKVEAESSEADYDKGRHFALYEVISLLIQQADAFGIDRAVLGLAHVDPERDILAKDV